MQITNRADDWQRRDVKKCGHETKSRRLFMTMRPSLYDNVKQLAAENGVSVSDTIHQILEDYIIYWRKLKRVKQTKAPA